MSNNMFSWVASWYYGQDITKDETIYEVEDATEASFSGDVICTAGKDSNEWTWIETITDESSEKKTQLLIQSTRKIDDDKDKLICLNKIKRKYFKKQCRQLPQRIYPGVNEKNSRAINRWCSTKGTCTERQLVRYCLQYKSSADTLDINALFTCKPIVKFFLNMGITDIKSGDDIKELLLHLVNKYEWKDQINENKQPKRDFLMIEWKKEDIETKDHCKEEDRIPSDHERNLFAPTWLLVDREIEPEEDWEELEHAPWLDVTGQEDWALIEEDASYLDEYNIELSEYTTVSKEDLQSDIDEQPSISGYENVCDISELTELFGNLHITTPQFHDIPEWMRNINLFDPRCTTQAPKPHAIPAWMRKIDLFDHIRSSESESNLGGSLNNAPLFNKKRKHDDLLPSWIALEANKRIKTLKLSYDDIVPSWTIPFNDNEKKPASSAASRSAASSSAASSSVARSSAASSSAAWSSAASSSAASSSAAREGEEDQYLEWDFFVGNHEYGWDMGKAVDVHSLGCEVEEVTPWDVQFRPMFELPWDSTPCYTLTSNMKEGVVPIEDWLRRVNVFDLPTEESVVPVADWLSNIDVFGLLNTEESIVPVADWLSNIEVFGLLNTEESIVPVADWLSNIDVFGLLNTEESIVPVADWLSKINVFGLLPQTHPDDHPTTSTIVTHQTCKYFTELKRLGSFRQVTETIFPTSMTGVVPRGDNSTYIPDVTRYHLAEDRLLVTSFRGKASLALTLGPDRLATALKKAWVKKSRRASKLSRTTRRLYRNTPTTVLNKHLKGEVALMRKFVLKKAKKEEGSQKLARISSKSRKHRFDNSRRENTGSY